MSLLDKITDEDLFQIRCAVELGAAAHALEAGRNGTVHWTDIRDVPSNDCPTCAAFQRALNLLDQIVP